MNRRVRPPARRLRIGRWVLLAVALGTVGWLVAGSSGPTSGERSAAAAAEDVAAKPFVPLTYSSSITAPHPDHVGLPITGEIKNGVAISLAMQRAGVPGEDIDAIVAATKDHFDWRVSRPGHTFEVLNGPDERALWFRYKAGATTIVHAYRDAKGKMRGLAENVYVKTSTAYVEGTIDHSLYVAMDEAGEGAALTMMFVELFAWDIDFFTETQKGDKFRMLVQKQSVAGKPVRYGKILGAEYKMATGRTHRAFHYTLENGTGGYYDQEGGAVKKAFLKSPIRFASITSRFGMRRHPVLKYKRAHRGVDYGAPRGAAIWAMGNGVVKKAGRGGGYGKVVYINHRNGLETRYAHLSRFGKGIRRGTRVSQKQVIGYVGSTGLATGPHLHFEVLRKGRHVNPLSVAVPPAPPVPKKEKQRFAAHVAPIVRALEARRAPVVFEPPANDFATKVDGPSVQPAPTGPTRPVTGG